MTIPSNVANFNGAAPVIDPDDAVMLLIDHQSGYIYKLITGLRL